jgi:hypothetical protein
VRKILGIHLIHLFEIIHVAKVDLVYC